MDREEVWREFSALPHEAQEQVADFIAFLRARYIRSRPRKKPQRTASLADEPFIGIWQGRKDMQDSTTWVRGVREQEWLKTHE